ncbi:hypothetical protein ACN4EK_15680 [Pantanalinema rosaneae CENA516]|uniref:hypothetical protein n=1 Tax=Pantanalinema rosaneae TaxID=1620701 RepID=UPI003D6EF39D
MTLDSFFDNFALLTDAPNAVLNLREIVLQLAVQGKLVPQDSSDEPVSVLLERIRLKKAQLLKAGKIGKSQSNYSISLDEVP